MKLLLLTALLLLCSTQVLTLKCYTCSGPTDTVCVEETECQAGETYCKTVEKDEAISSRTCEQMCVESHDTNCCEEDFC